MAEAPKEDSQPHIAIQKIYVKDLSFETPNSPQMFLDKIDKWEPEINLQLSNSASALKEDTHEVVLSVTVTAKIKDKTAFLVEVQLAGIFNMVGFDKAQLAAWMGSYCPQLLFPYAREVVSDLVTRGGFPQLLLAPINFDALYRQHLEQGNTAQAGESTH
jgi:preprotein translocase subunit SecB